MCKEGKLCILKRRKVEIILHVHVLPEKGKSKFLVKVKKKLLILRLPAASFDNNYLCFICNNDYFYKLE